MLPGHIWSIWQWDNKRRYYSRLIYNKLRLRNYWLAHVPARERQNCSLNPGLFDLPAANLCVCVCQMLMNWQCQWCGDSDPQPKDLVYSGGVTTKYSGGILKDIRVIHDWFLSPNSLFPWKRGVLPLIPTLRLTSYLSLDKQLNSLIFFPYLLYWRGEIPAAFWDYCEEQI